MKLTIFFLVLILSVETPSQFSDEEFIDEISSGLNNLEKFHKIIKNFHPYLNDLQPVAVIKGDELFLFDADSIMQRYSFIRKIKPPFPMDENIRASFPFMDYDNRPVCFTGKDAFNSAEGMAVIFHEFVHCSQFNTIEQKLKNSLNIYKTSIEQNNFMWEINHPFPFDTMFLSNYEKFIKSLQAGGISSAEKYRKEIKEKLSRTDFEYMVWQEWKEGFARYLENKIIREAYGNENNGGNDFPPDRVVFYYGGEKFIEYLISNESDLISDQEKLFNIMLHYPGE